MGRRPSTSRKLGKKIATSAIEAGNSNNSNIGPGHGLRRAVAFQRFIRRKDAGDGRRGAQKKREHLPPACGIWWCFPDSCADTSVKRFSRAARIEKSSGAQRLDEAALAAVRVWRCNPARRDGKPVRAIALQPFDFILQ